MKTSRATALDSLIPALVVITGLAALVCGLLMQASEAHADTYRWTKAKLQAAASSKNKRFCEKTWPNKKRTTAAEDRRCSVYWAINYGYDDTDPNMGTFDMDPRPGHPIFARHSAATLVRLAERAEKLCEKHECDSGDDIGLAPEERAAEMFRITAADHFTLEAGIILDYRPVLDLLLTGKPLPKGYIGQDDAGLLGAVHLRKLRNAVYARHGRPFKDPDLQAFFYEAKPAIMKRHFKLDLEERRKYRRLPLKVNPNYDDSLLTRIDKQNIQRIRAQEKKDWGR